MALLGGAVVLGIASRSAPAGYPLYDESLGDALYAAAAYLVLGLLRPAARPALLAAAALGFCAAVECFQLTGLPMRLAPAPPGSWVLGTTFAWHDLVCYAGGVGGVLVLDHLCRRRRSATRAAALGSLKLSDAYPRPGRESLPRKGGRA